MKNNALWYLSPIAFALLSVSWLSHTEFSNGTYAYIETDGSRTIQSEPTQERAHCVTDKIARDAFDENVISPGRHMRTAVR